MSLKHRVAAAYFLSGFAALIYEVVWTREVTHVLGASLYAISTSTGLFLGGLAIGAAAGGGWFGRGHSSVSGGRLANLQARFTGTSGALRAYAVIQVLVATLGAFLPLLFNERIQEVLWSAIGIGNPTASTIARVLFCSILIVPVAALMGAAFPVLVSADQELPKANESAVPAPVTGTGCGAQWLYTVNTVGGAAGAIACGFFMLPHLGLQGSNCVASALSMLSFILVFPPVTQAAGTVPTSPDPQSGTVPQLKDRPAATVPPSNNPLSGVLAASFLTGFLVMTAEVTSTRLLNLVLGSSTYSVSAVLALTIGGLALGAAIATRYLLQFRQPLLLAAAALTGGALYICVLIYLLDSLPWTFIAIFKALQAAAPAHVFATALTTRLLVAAIVVLPPAVCSGPLLPLLLSAAKDSRPADPPAATAGLIYASNSAGCIAGAFLTGFVLIPLLGQLPHCQSGIQATFIVVISVQIALAAFLFHAFCQSYIADRPTRLLTVGIAAMVALCVVLDVVFCKPPWKTAVMSAGADFYAPEDIRRVKRGRFEALMTGAAGGGSVLFYREGLNSTISVESFKEHNIICLKSDGKVEAALPMMPRQPAPGSDIRTQMSLATLPLDLAAGSAHDGLLIGYGTGMTTVVAAGRPGVRTLTIAELEPAVYACSHFFAPVTGDPINADRNAHPTIVPLLNDGRYVLQSSSATYDVVICQPSDPWVNGSSELFSREFFALIKNRLSANGVICQWVPLYGIDPACFGVLSRTFSSVFPHALLYHEQGAGECLLVGFASETEGIAEIIHTRELFPTASVVDKRGINIMCERLAAVTGESRINTDDNLLVEYAAAKGAMTQESRISDNLRWLEKYAH